MSGEGVGCSEVVAPRRSNVWSRVSHTKCCSESPFCLQLLATGMHNVIDLRIARLVLSRYPERKAVGADWWKPRLLPILPDQIMIFPLARFRVVMLDGEWPY